MVKSDIERIRLLLREVTDPEIPVLTVEDLGILQQVKQERGRFEVVITPTYSGCPAVDRMAGQIRRRLQAAGFGEVTVSYALYPPWTTGRITEEGRKKLEAFGIAPPAGPAGRDGVEEVACPRCHSLHTKMISFFGSTACKAFYQCQDCLEPFDYFKCLK